MNKVAKIRLLQHLHRKGIIDINDFYVITIDDKIRLQGNLNGDKRIKYENVFNKKINLEEEDWLQIRTKNFVITLTF